MTNVVAISFAEVAAEAWEEFLSERPERLRGDDGLRFAKEWSLWTRIRIVTDGRDLLASNPTVASLIAIAIDVPQAVEAAERVGRAEWLVGHEGPIVNLERSEDGRELAVSVSSYGATSPVDEGTVAWQGWVQAARTCFREARSRLKSRVRGEHEEILEEWMQRWCPWWFDM